MTSQTENRIREDIKTAMKAREKERLGVLRMLSSQLKDAAIAKREDLDEEEVLRILMSYAKKRKEGAAEMRKAQREDLAIKEEAELVIVEGYLPSQLGDAELQELVEEAVRETGAESMKDMSGVMKAAMEKAEGRADGSRISAAVKARLSPAG